MYFKESYEIGSESNQEEYNIWLPEDAFPGFRQFMTDFFWKLHEVSMAILDALLMGLDLSHEEEDFIRSLHSSHDSQLRLLHYPPIPHNTLDKTGVSRLGDHKDRRSAKP